jgi:molecular chaperone GrpE
MRINIMDKKNDNEKPADTEKPEKSTEAQREDSERSVDNSVSSVSAGEIQSLKDKVEEAEQRYRRALADYQNLQRRVQEDRINWIQAANKELLLKLLPVLDTLMLAQKHINDKGLELSISQFFNVLAQERVEQIKTNGEKFDPAIMEAIGTAEGKKDIVVEEARAGYKLHDQILRSAQVIVGK